MRISSKKKSNCNFYNFSLLVPYLNKFLLVCIWSQNYLLHVCILSFHTFTWEFSLKEFFVCSSVHQNTQKSVYYCLVITPWKYKYCLIWALNKSILFGSNSLKVPILYMNSEKTFYYSLIWKELCGNVSIVWCKLWKSV